VQKRLEAVEWQQLHEDIGRLIRATGSHIKPPKPGTPITDMRRIKDYLAKEADIPTSVENTLNFFIFVAPMVENFVVTNLPFVKLQGWATVFQSTRDFMRGPLESIYRTNMVSFGYTMSPAVTLTVIIVGTMAITCFANLVGNNPTEISSKILNTFGGLFGITAQPARKVSVAAPVNAAPRPPPPPASYVEPVAGNSRPTMAPPPF